MGTIIVKIFTQAKLGEYHDLCINEFESLINEMKQYAKQRKSILYFSAMSNDPCGFPANSDCFAEIEYTGELQDADKQYYIATLRKLATDGSIEKDGMSVFETLKFVKFRHISDEIIIL